jgi:DNA primase large subunit
LLSGFVRYQVAFEEAGELVKSRRVYIERGYAYVPKSDIISIIVGAFRAQLSAALTATSKALPSLEEDTRLLPMLTNLSKQYLGSDYGNTGNKAVVAVTAAAVHQLAPESFPLCMRHSHNHLMENHHLKHGARMQYGLFLKVCRTIISMIYWGFMFRAPTWLKIFGLFTL